MAIEPISSAMTYQVQNTAVTKPAPKQEADTEVLQQQNTTSFDPSTVKITQAQDADAKSSSDDSSKSDARDIMEQDQATHDKIKKAVEELNKKMVNSEAVYGIHEATNHVTIKIIDKETKETIKELPAEKTLDMIAKVWEMAGILVDEKR